MRQKVQVTPGKIYVMGVYVSSIQADQLHPANLIWFTNVTGDRICANSNAKWSVNRYAKISCAFIIPTGTTGFRVKLKSDAQPGDWIVADDWYLGESNDFSLVQAFATIQFDPVTNKRITGMRANLWTGQQPSGYSYVSSPMGICRVPGTCDGAIEVGYVKGTRTSNALKPYLGWQNPGTNPEDIIYPETLSDNTFYQFEVNYDDSYGVWNAKLGSRTVQALLNFTFGKEAVCGGEARDNNLPADPPLGIECYYLEYRDENQVWHVSDYNATRTGLNYCIRRQTYGAIAEGPC